MDREASDRSGQSEPRGPEGVRRLGGAAGADRQADPEPLRAAAPELVEKRAKGSLGRKTARAARPLGAILLFISSLECAAARPDAVRPSEPPPAPPSYSWRLPRGF